MNIPVSSIWNFTQQPAEVNPPAQGFVTPVMTLMTQLGCLCTQHGRLFSARWEAICHFSNLHLLPLTSVLTVAEEISWRSGVGVGASNRSHRGGVAGDGCSTCQCQEPAPDSGLISSPIEGLSMLLHTTSHAVSPQFWKLSYMVSTSSIWNQKKKKKKCPFAGLHWNVFTQGVCPRNLDVL